MGRNSRQRLTVSAHRKSGELPIFTPLSFRYRNTRTALMTCTALCAIVTVAVTPLPAVALPQNGQVVSGTAQIVIKPNEINVIQTSSQVVINWSSFNIAAGEKVLFLQGNAAAQALNQILGGGSSQIMGQLQSNGMVIISNPNGILIGQGADVRVGAIIATTAAMSAQAQAAFLAGGKASFDIASNSATASVVNHGSITAGQAGLVGLVAPGVENSGLIQARLGTVQLAAGNTFTIDLYGDKLIKLAPGDKVMSQVTAIDGTPLTALINNSGTISADGGTIILTANAAKTIVTNIINMDGIAKARSVGTSNGEIVLDGGETGVVHVAGTLDASGRDAGQTGGTVKVLGDKVGLFDGSRIDVAGDLGGGAVAVGGNFHGAGPDRNASFTYVASSAEISADALTAGNGGQVAVWADGTTNFNGTISAKGGALGGNGGFIETSGKQHLSVGDAAKVDLGASKGTTGTWLLDPTDITITSANSGAGTWDSGSPNIFTTGGSDTISAATLVANLATADVNISATNDIVVSSQIDSSSNGAAHGLTLTSTGGKIQLGADISTNGNQTYAGAVVLNSDVILYVTAGSNMAFNSTVDSGSSAHKLKTIVNSGTTTFTGAVGGSNALSWVELNAGNIYLGGNVTTTGEQDYTGTVILNNNITMDSSAGNGLVYFIFSAVNAATAGSQSLTVNAGTGNVKFLGGSVGATNSLSSLSVTGANISLGSNVTTSGNQTFAGAVVLTASDTLTSSSGNGNVSFSSTLNSDGTARALTIAAGTGNVGFGDTVGGGNSLASLAVTGSNITLGGNVTTSGNQTYTGAVLLSGSDILTSSSGNVKFSSTVDAGSAFNQGLVVTTGANVSFGGAVGVTAPLSYLTVNSSSLTLGGDVKTAGNQTYNQFFDAFLNANTVLTSSLGGSTGNVSFGSRITGSSVGGQSLTVAAGAGNVALGTLVGSGNRLASVAVTGNTITLGGSVTTSGNQTYAGAVLLTNATLDSSASNGNVSFSSTVDATVAASRQLNVAAGTGNVTFGGAVGGSASLSNLSVTGSNIKLGGNVTTAGNQTYTGKVVLTATDTLDSSAGNGNMYFSSYVDAATYGGQGLTITAGTGNAKFIGLVGSSSPLASLAVSAGKIQLPDITTTGNQAYTGAVTISGSETLSSSAGNGNISFSSTVAGASASAQMLTLAAGTGNVTFGGAVGTTKLASLDVTGSNITLGGSVTTNTNQTYTGAVILGANDTLTSSTGNVAFSSTVDATTAGSQNLTVSAGAGNISFGGVVGGANKLGTLNSNGVHTLLSGNVTANSITAGNVKLVNSLTMTADSMSLDTFDGSVADTQGLSLVGTGSGSATLTGTWGGSARLASLSASNFTGIYIRTAAMTTSGNQTYGSPTYFRVASATLTSSSGNGNVAFGSTVEAYNANSDTVVIDAGTGNVSFGGTVGASTALVALTVTGGTVTLGGNVTTTGNQTYTGPVVLSATDTLSSSASNGNIAFSSTVNAAAAGTQGLTLASGTGNVTFGGAVGGSSRLASLSVTGGKATLGGNVTTSGNQTYTGATVLTGSDTLDSSAGNGNIAFTSTVDATTADTQALILAAGTGNVAFGDAVGATNRLASLSVTGGKATLGGNVTTSGNQTYTGPVVLSATDTLNSSASNGNVSFTSTVDGTTVSQQGLTVTSGTGNVTFGGIVGGIKALLSRTVNGASLSKGSGGISVVPTTTTASTSQTTNAVVNTISNIVGGSASSGSTSQSPSASSSGVSTRVAFAPDVFAKEYKLVTVSPALSQQNPSANQAGSSLFGGTGTGGNTVTASTGGNGGGGASTTSAPTSGTSPSTSNAPATDSGASSTSTPAPGTSSNASASGAKPATSNAPANAPPNGTKPATTTTTGTSTNNSAPAPAVGTTAAPARPVTAAQARAQAKAEVKAQAKAAAAAKAKAKAEVKAQAKAAAAAKAKAKAEARAQVRG